MRELCFELFVGDFCGVDLGEDNNAAAGVGFKLTVNASQPAFQSISPHGVAQLLPDNQHNPLCFAPSAHPQMLAFDPAHTSVAAIDLYGEPFASATTTTVYDRTARSRFHAFAKTMFVAAFPSAWLVCSLHETVLIYRQRLSSKKLSVGTIAPIGLKQNNIENPHNVSNNAICTNRRKIS